MLTCGFISDRARFQQLSPIPTNGAYAPGSDSGTRRSTLQPSAHQRDCRGVGKPRWGDAARHQRSSVSHHPGFDFRNGPGGVCAIVDVFAFPPAVGRSHGSGIFASSALRAAAPRSGGGAYRFGARDPFIAPWHRRQKNPFAYGFDRAQLLHPLPLHLTNDFPPCCPPLLVLYGSSPRAPSRMMPEPSVIGAALRPLIVRSWSHLPQPHSLSFTRTEDATRFLPAPHGAGGSDDGRSLLAPTRDHLAQVHAALLTHDRDRVARLEVT